MLWCYVVTNLPNTSVAALKSAYYPPPHLNELAETGYLMREITQPLLACFLTPASPNPAQMEAVMSSSHVMRECFGGSTLYSVKPRLRDSATLPSCLAMFQPMHLAPPQHAIASHFAFFKRESHPPTLLGFARFGTEALM